MVAVWNWIPHLREVEDTEEEVVVVETSSGASREDSPHPKDQIEIDEKTPEVKVDDHTVRVLEYRDEANRKWWKFFDEYEYRYNKSERSKHDWWRWYDKGTPKDEKKLLIKIDILVAFYAFVVYWLKYIDQVNLNNAYVSGMKEDIGMKGDDLVNTQAVYTVGAVIFQIPFMYIFPRFPLHYVIPSLDICWGLCTLGLYRVHNLGSLMTLRFFVGVFEAAFYPCVHYLFGSWYKASELGRRGAIYYWGQMLGTITAGLLASATARTLAGVHGLEGWRWMYILDAIITIPIGILGFFSIPGTPDRCYSIWLTDEEIRLARRRLKAANVAPADHETPFFDKKLWWKIITGWKIYVFSLMNIFLWNNSNTPTGAYVLWLKSLNRYNTAKLNEMSTLTPALGIIWVAIMCFGADAFRSRFGAIAFSQFWNIIGNILLAVWNIPERAKWFAFCLQYMGWSQASVTYGWFNDILRHNGQERAIIWILSYMIGQSSTAWITILIFPTTDQPRYMKGFITTACFALAQFVWAFVLLWFYKREEKSNALENGIVLFNSKTDEKPPEVEEVKQHIIEHDAKL